MAIFTMGGGPKPEQTKTVTPTAAGLVVNPDAGKVLSSVTVNGDADLVAGNIKSGVDIFGVAGVYTPVVEPIVAGGFIIYESLNISQGGDVGMSKAKEVRVKKAGTYRVMFEFFTYSVGESYAPKAQIYVNGSAYSAVSSGNTTAYVFWLQNVTVSANAYIQIYCESQTMYGKARVRNFMVGVKHNSSVVDYVY